MRFRADRVPGAAALAALALLLPGGAGAKDGGAEISSNWTGYAVTGTAFRSVSAAWRQPAADCFGRAVDETDASFWVGLGGDLDGSRALEQIGTETDCAPSGHEDVYAWYELWPRDAENLSLRVRPGDEVWAAVSVRGAHVTLRLVNRTTGRSFRRMFLFPRVDVSSAEWIVEPPVEPLRRGDYPVPLTDFGSIVFTDAHAVGADGRRGSITSGPWHAHKQVLMTWIDPVRSAAESFLDVATAAHIVPSRVTRHGTSFRADYRRRLPKASRSTPAGAA